MSNFDHLIGRLHETGADRLVLATGKPPLLDLAGEAAPADESVGDPLTREALDAMIAQMGGTEELGRQELLYRAPSGGVLVTARRTERLVQLIVIPAETGRPEPVAVGGERVREGESGGEARTFDADDFDEPLDVEVESIGAGSVAPIDPVAGGFDVAPSDRAPETPETRYGFDEAPSIEGEAAAERPSPDVETPDEAEPSPGDGPFLEVDSAFDDGAPAAVMSEIDADLFDPPGPEPVVNPDPGGAATRVADVGPNVESEARDAPDAATGTPTPDAATVAPTTDAGGASKPDLATDAAPVADGGRVFDLRPDAPAMERLFVKMVEHGCSDLHVSSGSAPLFRVDGRIKDIGGEPSLSPGQTEALLMGITPDRYRKQFEETNDADFAYQIPGVARFRCNLFRDRKGMGGVFRQIPADILSADTLGLPKPLLDMCQLKKGLILVTGPTGSGKSTTLAALIDHINRTRQDHIITIEDPIEFVHDNGTCLVNQREVGEHTRSFKVALRAALREDPDIVLVGELRDLETVEIALETAETGHLVFGTLHTNTAPGTVSRLIDQFPAGQQAQIRTMLADTLKAVVAQTLCRKREGGRIAALEILVVTNAVANLIREDKTHQIPSSMQTGRSQGMRTLNDSLLDLVVRRVVDVNEAYWNAVDKPEFIGVLKRNGIEVEGLGQE